MARRQICYALQYKEENSKPQYFFVNRDGKKDSTNYSDLEELVQVAGMRELNVKFKVPKTVLAKVRKNFLPPHYISPVENNK